MSINKRLEKFCVCVLWMLETAMFALLALLNLRYSAHADLQAGIQETITYSLDSAILFGVALFCGCLIIWAIEKLCRRLSFKTMLLLSVMVTGIIGWWWMFHSGYDDRGDQHALFCSSWNMMENNFCDFEQGEYLFRWPFQLGFAACLELLYRMFGGGNILPLTILNWAATVGIHSLLCQISGFLFGKKKTGKIHAILMTGFLPGVLVINYLYGNTLGTFLGFLSLWLLLKWHYSFRWGWAVGSCLAMAFAILLKSFNLILLVAQLIFLGLVSLRRRTKAPVLVAAVMLVLVWAVGEGVDSVYRWRLGRELPQEPPKILWIAMGMQDNWEGWRAPGWYNMYNYTVFEESGFNSEEASRRAKKDIAARLREFVSDPAMAAEFYKLKTLSQWAEPTYQGFWISYDYLNLEKYDPKMQQIYLGAVGKAIERYMKWYQTAIWILAAVCMIGRRKQMNLSRLLPGLIILGGFLFSFLWEGKSQYTLPYFWLATIYGAAGLEWVFQRISSMAGNCLDKQSE